MTLYARGANPLPQNRLSVCYVMFRARTCSCECGCRRPEPRYRRCLSCGRDQHPGPPVRSVPLTVRAALAFGEWPHAS